MCSALQLRMDTGSRCMIRCTGRLFMIMMLFIYYNESVEFGNCMLVYKISDDMNEMKMP